MLMSSDMYWTEVYSNAIRFKKCGKGRLWLSVRLHVPVTDGA